MSKNRVVSGDVFLNLLRSKSSRIGSEPLVVKDVVHIKSEEVAFEGTVHFENVTFNRMVFIEGYKIEGGLLLRNCQFLELVKIDDCAFGHISIHHCEGASLSFWQCEAEAAGLDKIKMEGNIDLSGLTLTKELVIGEIECELLELVNPRVTKYALVTPRVRTDNIEFAEQFRYAGIPVFISTAALAQKKAIEAENLRRLIHAEVQELLKTA